MDIIENETKEDEVLPEVPYQDYMRTPSVIRDEVLRESYLTLLYHGTFTDSFSITDLDGDTDKNYKLTLRGRESAGVIGMTIRFNNDGGANYDYTYQYFGGTQAAPATNYSVQDGKTGIYFITDLNNFIIDANLGVFTTGYKRLLTWDGANENEVASPNNYKLHWEGMGFWNNTTSKITQINIVLTASITEGEYWLFKVKT